ncbi:hypothetical protein [Agromyces sp. SYSU T00194]|uniref:hypothetical protein n=1 Tax=Agromyces chitinivorans TaxID=3158560 RepID=UPI0033984E9F
MGTPLMPWQELVANVALEVDPETGQLAYRSVIIKVPRQAGKTTLAMAVTVHRALAFRNIIGVPQKIIYTAQTGQDAFKKWSDQADDLEVILGKRVHKRGGNNVPTLRFSNLSEYRPISVTKKSGPSQSNDLVHYDEAWGHENGSIESGLNPTMIAREQPQAWIYSNAGVRTSKWWKGKWELGRRLVEDQDTTSGICYFEWSASREDDDYDPSNPEYVARHHPAAGITIDIAGFRTEYLTMLADPDEGLEGYERAYCNVEPEDLLAQWTVVTREQWNKTGVEQFINGRRSFAFDVTNDRSWASVSWAGLTADGRSLSELVTHRRSPNWVVPYFEETFDKYPRYERKVYCVAGGAAATLEADFKEAGIELIMFSRGEYAAACGDYSDGLEDGTTVHLADGQDDLKDAIAGATWSTTGDARVWDRKKSTTVLSPLVACTVAQRGFRISAEADYDVSDSVA